MEYCHSVRALGRNWTDQFQWEETTKCCVSEDWRAEHAWVMFWIGELGGKYWLCSVHSLSGNVRHHQVPAYKPDHCIVIASNFAFQSQIYSFEKWQSRSYVYELKVEEYGHYMSNPCHRKAKSHLIQVNDENEGEFREIWGQFLCLPSYWKSVCFLV